MPANIDYIRHVKMGDGDPKNLLRMSDLTQVAAMLQLAPPPLEISLILHADSIILANRENELLSHQDLNCGL